MLTISELSFHPVHSKYVIYCKIKKGRSHTNEATFHVLNQVEHENIYCLYIMYILIRNKTKIKKLYKNLS